MTTQNCDCPICGQQTGTFDFNVKISADDDKKVRRELMVTVTESTPTFSCDCFSDEEKVMAWIQRTIEQEIKTFALS